MAATYKKRKRIRRLAKAGITRSCRRRLYIEVNELGRPVSYIRPPTAHEDEVMINIEPFMLRDARYGLYDLGNGDGMLADIEEPENYCRMTGTLMELVRVGVPIHRFPPEPWSAKPEPESDKPSIYTSKTRLFYVGIALGALLLIVELIR